MGRQSRGGARIGGAPSLAPLAAALAVAMGLPSPALGTGDASAAPDPSGTYRNVAADHGRSAIEAAVERAIDGLFALAKPTARNRLQASNPPIETLRIEVRAETIRVDLGHGRDATLRGGTWGAGRSADGTSVRVRYTVMPDGSVKMETRTDGGSARHVFRASEDGTTLRHSVRIESSHLPDAVRYTLRFRRAS